MLCRRLLFTVVLGAMLCALATPTLAQKEGKESAATKAAPRTDKGWVARQDKFNDIIAKGNADLLFIGDSITHGWEGGGAKEVWDKYYGKRNAVNLGIGGDQTQHVLWRLQNGNLKGITPKLAVIMIGTNNAGGSQPEDTARGIKLIMDEINKQSPKTNILVLAIFPRGKDSSDKGRVKNEKVNAIVKYMAKYSKAEKNITFLDIGQKFLETDGTLSKDIMPDLLHLSKKGYEIWAESIEPTVQKLMGEKAE